MLSTESRTFFGENSSVNTGGAPIHVRLNTQARKHDSFVKKLILKLRAIVLSCYIVNMGIE